MLPPDDQCDEACSMPGSAATTMSVSAMSSAAFYSLPFTLTFLAVGFAARYKLFPTISTSQTTTDEDYYLPSDAPSTLRHAHTEQATKSVKRQFVASTFAITIALSAVLAELILCEISDFLDQTTRSFALGITLPTLLFLLVVVIPFLEIQSVLAHLGWSRPATQGISRRLPWILQAGTFLSWLLLFWYLGKGISGSHVRTRIHSTQTLHEACLERVGLIGIALMALLSGFAAISAPWQTFGSKLSPVLSSDLTRKEAGLDSTSDMLAAKESRLRSLRRKVASTVPSTGVVTKVMSSLRSDPDVQEIKALELEISGLRSMEAGLSSSLNVLRSRYASERRAASPAGKLIWTPISYFFSLYCIYRVVNTAVVTLQRHFASASFVQGDSDPITRTLSLLAEHVDPNLNQAAWTRQISFFLSGIMLLASFNSVIQTFYMLTKVIPSLLHQAQANLALIIAQLCASYVISTALLLRSSLPSEMKSVVSDALGTPLQPRFVDQWFEGWFMFAAATSALGIWLNRHFQDADDWDDYEGLEMGQKRM